MLVENIQDVSFGQNIGQGKPLVVRAKVVCNASRCVIKVAFLKTELILFLSSQSRRAVPNFGDRAHRPVLSAVRLGNLTTSNCQDGRKRSLLRLLNLYAADSVPNVQKRNGKVAILEHG